MGIVAIEDIGLNLYVTHRSIQSVGNRKREKTKSIRSSSPLPPLDAANLSSIKLNADVQISQK